MNADDRIEFCPSASLVVDVIPDHSEWDEVVREEWNHVRVRYQGLGAWLVTCSAESAAVDDHWGEFVAEARARLRQRPLSRVSVRNFPEYLEEESKIDRDWLGQYSDHGGIPVVRLWIDRITKTASELACDWRVLLRIVLRHELGHHVAPASDDESRFYDSTTSESNNSTCRVEGAAQLFAWITSDDSDREIIRWLAAKQPTAYSEYQKYLTFARQTAPVWEALGPCNVIPGWLLAWRLASFAPEADQPMCARSRIKMGEGGCAATSPDGNPCICVTIWYVADRKPAIQAQTELLEALPDNAETELRWPVVYTSLGGELQIAAMLPQGNVVWFWVLKDKTQINALGLKDRLIAESL